MNVRQGRRGFLKAGAAGAAATALSATAKAAGANDRLRVGIIGCGGRGQYLAGEFGKIDGVQILYVCEPDGNRLAEAQKKSGAKHAVADMRKALDDKDLDAVVIATPDHWHTPAAILACEAKKHVYVEKPCSHNIREGRLLVEAAARNDRLVQHGTQSRSVEQLKNAFARLKEGVIGEVLAAKAINSQKRANIGHASPSKPPADLDFDLWVGPAQMVDYQPNLLHYHWHWFYPFGTGDIGNDGVHQIDVARWGLGVQTHPTRAFGWGAKLFFDDDQQFPDSYVVTFEYAGAGPRGMPLALTFEQRIWTPYEIEGCENGDIFYGSDGMMTFNKGIVRTFGPKNKLIREEKVDYADAASRHIRNFVDAVRTGSKLNAPIEVGHMSSSLAHLGNIVARSGKSIEFDPQSETIKNPEKLRAMVSREYRKGHWAAPKTV